MMIIIGLIALLTVAFVGFAGAPITGGLRPRRPKSSVAANPISISVGPLGRAIAEKGIPQ
jgi:hypothetical protein